MPDNLTQSEIEELASEYKTTVYGEMHTRMNDDMDVINASQKWGMGILNQYTKGFPKGFVPKIDPWAKKIRDIAVGNTHVGERPKVTFSLPPDEKPIAERERKRQVTENLFRAIVQNIADRFTVSPFVSVLQKQHGIGGGALTFPFKWNEWKALQKAADGDSDEYDRLQRDFFPWDVSASDPRNLMPDPDTADGIPDHYILVDKITARAAAKLYPDKKDSMKMSDKKGTKVDRIIYLSLTQYTVIIGGVVVTDGENPCGMIWHEWCWGGYGEVDEERRMENLGVGIIRNVKGTLSRIVANDNIADAYRANAAFSPLHVSDADDGSEAREAVKTLEYGPNKVWPTGPLKVDRLPQNEMPQSVVWSQQESKQMVEIIGGSEILTGAAPAQPASEHRQRVGLAQVSSKPAQVIAEQATGNMLRKMAHFYKYELGEKEYAIPKGKGGELLKVNVDDILEDGNLLIEFTPTSDEDRAADQVANVGLFKDGVISMETLRARLGIEDGTQQDLNNLVRIIVTHPTMQEVGVMVARQRLLQRLGIPDPNAAMPIPQGKDAAATNTTTAAPAPPPSGYDQPIGDGRQPSGPGATQMAARDRYAAPVGVGA